MAHNRVRQLGQSEAPHHVVDAEEISPIQEVEPLTRELQVAPAVCAERLPA